MIKNENEDITDNELYFLIKQTKTLLNDNNQIILKYDDNIILKNVNNNNNKFKTKDIMSELYLELHKAIFKINSLLDLFNNNNINNSKENENLINNILNNNNLSNDNNNISNDNNNNNISNENNIIINFCNIFHSKSKNSIDINKNNKTSLEVNENIKQYKIKKIKNTNKFINKKRNIFKTSNKISRYRGVSLNKNKWQAYIWMNKKNTYLGTYSCEKMAAKIYDVIAIKKSGFKAKTNFKYNSNEIKKINNSNIDINYLLGIATKIYN